MHTICARYCHPDLSADERYALYTASYPKYEEKQSAFIQQLILYDVETKNTKTLSNLDDSCTNPCFSPDGNIIAFLSSRSGKKNIWLLPTHGGEAWRLTDTPTDISAFQWTPDGKSIGFTMFDAPSFSVDEIEVVDQNPQRCHLYIVAVQERSCVQTHHRLTEGNISVRSDVNFSYSSDGQEIAFAYSAQSTFNDWAKTDIAIINCASKEIKRPFDVSTGARHSPYFSPDGQWLAVVKHEHPYQYDFTATIELFNLKDHSAIEFDLSSIDAEFGLTGKFIGWNKGSTNLYLLQAEGTEIGIFAFSIEDKRIKKLPLPLPVASDVKISRSTDQLICILQGCETPPEVYLIDQKSVGSQKISEINAHLPCHLLGATQKISWQSYDQTPAEGLLTYPKEYQKGKKYPLVVMVHGGPMGVFSEYFIALPNRLYYATACYANQGYFVLCCNIRGSTGYGATFRKMNFFDWGGKDFEDLMSGVDYVIQQKDIDAQRIGIGGSSYGRFMTAWAIGHSDRFKVASIGAPVINLISEFGTSDAQAFLETYFESPFWKNAALYCARSPISYVDKIQTPIILHHGVLDRRVPMGQSDELYHEMKGKDIPIEYVRYPRTKHCIEEPMLLVEYANRNLKWFASHLSKRKQP